MLVSSLIDCGWGYDQIKEFIQKETFYHLPEPEPTPEPEPEESTNGPE